MMLTMMMMMTMILIYEVVGVSAPSGVAIGTGRVSGWEMWVRGGRVDKRSPKQFPNDPQRTHTLSTNMRERIEGCGGTFERPHFLRNKF